MKRQTRYGETLERIALAETIGVDIDSGWGFISGAAIGWKQGDFVSPAIIKSLADDGLIEPYGVSTYALSERARRLHTR